MGSSDSNSKKKTSNIGSKKNISFHYDLGNSFYEKWLDESMTYSSAMFKNPSDNLHKGQINKYENLANITGGGVRGFGH